MKIEFHKSIYGLDNLEKYLTSKEPEMGRTKKFFMFDYDSNNIEKDAFDSIKASLEENGFEYVSASNNDLWVFNPESFAMNFNLTHYNYRRSWEKVGVERVGIRKKEIPMMQVIPDVHFSGQINYERLFGIDPVSILKLLKGLGYSSTIKTTSQELETGVLQANENASSLIKKLNKEFAKKK